MAYQSTDNAYIDPRDIDEANRLLSEEHATSDIWGGYPEDLPADYMDPESHIGLDDLQSYAPPELSEDDYMQAARMQEFLDDDLPFGNDELETAIMNSKGSAQPAANTPAKTPVADNNHAITAEQELIKKALAESIKAQKVVEPNKPAAAKTEKKAYTPNPEVMLATQQAIQANMAQNAKDLIEHGFTPNEEQMAAYESIFGNPDAESGVVADKAKVAAVEINKLPVPKNLNDLRTSAISELTRINSQQKITSRKEMVSALESMGLSVVRKNAEDFITVAHPDFKDAAGKPRRARLRSETMPTQLQEALLNYKRSNRKGQDNEAAKNMQAESGLNKNVGFYPSRNLLETQSNAPSNLINAGTINSIPMANNQQSIAAKELPKSRYSSDSTHAVKLLQVPQKRKLEVQQLHMPVYGSHAKMGSLTINGETFGQKRAEPEAAKRAIPTAKPSQRPDENIDNLLKKSSDHPNHPESINKKDTNSNAPTNHNQTPAMAGGSGSSIKNSLVIGGSLLSGIGGALRPSASKAAQAANQAEQAAQNSIFSKDAFNRTVASSVDAFHNARNKWMNRGKPKPNLFSELPQTSPLHNLPPLAKMALNKAYVSKNHVDRSLNDTYDPRLSKGQKKSRVYDMNKNLRSYADSSLELTRILQNDKSIAPNTLQAANDYLDKMNKKVTTKASTASTKGLLDSDNQTNIIDKLEMVKKAVEGFKTTLKNITSAAAVLTGRRRP